MSGLQIDSPHYCDYVPLQYHSIILKHLLTPNAWIYMSPQATSIKVICEDINQEVILHQSGIIRINQYCHLESNNTKIYGNDLKEIAIINSFTQYKVNERPRTVTKMKPTTIDIRLIKREEDLISKPLNHSNCMNTGHCFGTSRQQLQSA